MGVEVRYTCHRCAAKERMLEVRARREDEDVVEWVQGVVMTAVAYDHGAFNCDSTKVDLKIHLPKDAEYIGQAPEQRTIQ